MRELEFRGVLDDTTMRSEAGTSVASAFSSVVLPVPVPPLIRMLSRFDSAWRARSTTSSVIIPTRTSSSQVQNFD
jgi:hypothetical protein